MSSEGIPDEWYFITPPQNVSWSKDSNSSEIDTYGTNNPYLSYGTTKLRKLTLGGAMIEGFSDGKNIEGNILDLEACMRMVLEEETGYTSPYCWKVFAGDKCYGTYIITGVSVNEQMRDMSGLATRATVDVSLTQVPSYQVSSGIDITAQVIQGSGDEKYAEQVDKLNGKNDAADQDKKVADANKANGTPSNGGGNGGGGSSSSGSGSNSTAAPGSIDYAGQAGNYGGGN